MAYPFKNLVLQGGGVKTFAYWGTLKVLEERGILPQIERVAGASAGAVLAALLSFRLPVDETFHLLNTVDFSRVPNTRTSHDILASTPEFIASYLDWLVGGADAMTRLMSHYGWYSTGYVQNWIEEMIAAHCDGNKLATFAEFRQRGYRDLYVKCTNISRRSIKVFSAQHTPDVPVAHALVMTQAIPLFFEAFQFRDDETGKADYYADGGILDNYPLHLFDSAEISETSAWYYAGINWETLGLRLYTPEDRMIAPRPINNVINYMANLLEAVLEAQDVAYENNPIDHKRTINISDCGVLSTDFAVRPEPDNTRYAELIESGQLAAQEFLDTYSSPNWHVWEWLRRRWMPVRASRIGV